MYAFSVMTKGLFEVRVCAVMLFLCICSVRPSLSADAADEKTSDSGSMSAADFIFPFIHMTVAKMNTTVTIEFNSTVIDTKNRTVVNAMYRNVRRVILEHLNRRKSTTTTTTTTHTPTPTTVTTPTTLGGVDAAKRKKRKRRQKKSDEDVIYVEMDLRFVEVDPEIDENNIFRMALMLHREGIDDLDFGSLLYETAIAVRNEGTLEKVTGVPVVAIYRGLPETMKTGAMHNDYNQVTFLVWPIVLMFVFLLLVVIGGLIYWKKNKANETVPITKPTESC